MLEKVRHSLLEEARRSPALLSDLAGLERYIAEKYDARSFVELLQNADDAGAERFSVRRTGDFLLVANDGRLFTREDFESLCRSATSTKQRGTSIGYRGIGFKSVVGFAETVYLFSGALEAMFSRELTARDIPEAAQVPLVRIPHPVDPDQRRQIATVLEDMVQQGFHTVFAFTELVASGIEAEFAAFDPTSLLFLRSIQQVELGSAREVITAQRTPALRDSTNTQVRNLRLSSADDTSLWKIIERDEVALAFCSGETSVERLEESQAVVHAFLPTHEKTGLGIKVNGDISTDPSRTRVVLDGRTAAGIEYIAKLIVDTVAASLGENSSLSTPDVLTALIPFSDPRLASLQRRSFLTDLMLAIQRSAGDRFRNLRYRPNWLNAADFEKLATASRIRGVGRDFEQVEGINAFLRFLGAREATLEDLSAGLRSSKPSTSGAAEVVSHITKLNATKQITPKEVEADWSLWTIDDTPLTLDEARDSAKPLDRSFVNMVSEKVGVTSELQRLVSDLVDSSASGQLVPYIQATEVEHTASTSPQAQQGSSLSAAPQRLSLKRWRSAEQQVLALLELQGWKVQDVSRQNVGYDIEGTDPEGREHSIEVKAIDRPGQPFTLTSNEEAVARQKGDAYQLAVVRQAGTNLEVAFIRDPANRLELTRQCRQWVWECSSYSYEPERFLLE
jgi:hypothetical protein